MFVCVCLGARLHRAAYWRAHALQTLCGDAIAALNEGLFGGRLGPRPLGQAWVFAATIGSNDSVSSPERRGKAASARPGKADNLVRLLQGARWEHASVCQTRTLFQAAPSWGRRAK